MRILADLHISPRTVRFLCSLGYDAVRLSDLLPANSSDEQIIAKAVSDSRIILTRTLIFQLLSRSAAKLSHPSFA